MPRRHGPSQRVCIVGTVADLPAVRQLLMALPRDSYGQAYVVGPHADPSPLSAPPRVSVTCVAGSPAEGHDPGHVLSVWAAEWLPEGPYDPQDSPTVWLGADALLHMTDAQDLEQVPQWELLPVPAVWDDLMRTR